VKKSTPLTASLIALALAPLTAHATNYTFTKIASTHDNSTINSFALASIASNGTVIYRAFDSSDPSGASYGTYHLYTASASSNYLPTSVAAQNNAPIVRFSNGPFAVNSSGAAAFGSNSTTSAHYVALFSNDGTGPVDRADTYLGASFTSLGNAPVQINDSGTLAFYGTPHAGLPSIFTLDNNGLHTIASAGGPAGITLSGNVALDNNGDVAFIGTSTLGGYTVFTHTAAGLAAIADDQGNYFSTFYAPSISDHTSTLANVAFRANLSPSIGGGSEIWAYVNGALEQITHTNAGVFNTAALGNTGVNSSGTVVFFAPLANGGNGIFTGDNLATDTIIKTGDALDGSTFTSGNLTTLALNDAGQIVFNATLADNSTGIYLATPTAVPEPMSLSLLTLGSLALLTRRNRAR